MIDNTKEYILCAAIKRNKPRKHFGYSPEKNDLGKIEIGYRHHDIYQRFNHTYLTDFIYKIFPKWTYKIKFIWNLYIKLLIKLYPLSAHDQGFYTSKGRYVDRYEGMEIAYLAGQVDEKTALSKDWYNIPLKVNGHVDTYEESAAKDKHKYNMLFSEDLY